MMLSHFLIGKLAYDISLKACVSPLKVADVELPCNEPRLNPLEFHGRRSENAVARKNAATKRWCAERSAFVHIC
ncbi:hypothetical protein E5678_05515 [Hydrogenophaga sp. PAMC20947]|nr:hypothetical protein E5678_05515 [Hydrogenophaga sp. PAMC20947]